MAIPISILLFLALAGSIAWFGYRHYVQPSSLLDQLRTSTVDQAVFRLENDSRQPFGAKRVLAALGQLLPVPERHWEATRSQLFAAGFREGSAAALFYGIKSVTAVLFLLLGFSFREHIDAPVLRAICPFTSGAAGWFLCTFVLKRLITRRQENLRFALPDVLDLMVICSEAGSGLDQAIVNVCRDLRPVHPVMAEELAMVNLEIRAGSSRADALRSLAKRCGEEEIRKLVAVLIQTDRFGTSISEALRTQSEFLRSRRRQEAEERAGKVGVKLVFPIFFFCLPALLIVTAGPALLQLFTNFFPLLGQAGR